MMKNKQPPPRVSPIKPRKPDPISGGREGDITHWSGRVQETVVSALPDDILHLTIHGGADNGSFCYLEDIDHQKINYHSGKLQPDSIILEIQGQKISGNTLRDAVTWLKQVTQNGAPVMIKTVKIGLLPKDLRLYLASRFSKGSIDHDLQQTIRDNLYMRTVPCTTRSPRPGESNGVDYTFLTLEEFQELEKSGALLESGIFDGNHYGTPKPPKEPQGALIHRSSSLGSNLTGAHPSAEGKRRRNHSNTETPPKSPGPVRKEPPPAPARKKSIEKAHSTNDLGPLPSNWEMAYTEDGHVYFIDHITEKTHWLDPRLAKLQKDDFLQCSEDELPFGWEKVEDPHYGTYYIDHVNRKTQYENPVVRAKKEAVGQVSSSTLTVTNKNSDQIMRSTSESDMNGRGSPPAYHARHSKTKNIPTKRESKRVFTKNPKELKGELFSTSLLKGPRGLGFTIIGGDHIDEEFLQIKNVVPNGPAFLDGKLKTGDVLVYVNDHCVLGYTHQDVVSLFQIIPIGDTVSLKMCRGYPLPFDPDDPNTEIITTVAVSLPNDTRSSNSPASYSSRENPNMDRHNTSTKSIKSLPDLAKSANVNQDSFFSQQSGQGNFSNSDTPDVVQSKPEFFSIKIVRGENGFGFTIAHSAHGQRVKQILDKPRCKDLQEGDVLIEINNIPVHNMSHSEIVSVLKDCPVEEETTIIVQRGGIPPKGKRPVRNRTGEENEGDDSLNTTQPGAYFFSAVQNETDGPPPEVPARPKTPSSSEQRPKTPIQGENRPKTPTRPNHIPAGDTWSKMQAGTRPPFSDMTSFRAPPHSAQLPRKEYISHEDSREYGNLDPELNNSRGSDHYNGPGNYDYNSQPPPGSRFDPFHQDLGHRSDFRGRSPYPMHNSYDKDSRFDYSRGETIRPGQFRSRTPGPEMMQRTQGFDMKPDPHRPKTPTAGDMRSKTPLPGGYGQIPGGNPDFLANSRYQNSWGHNGTLRQGFDDPNRIWGSSIPEHSNSPHLPLRHDNTDTFGRNFGNPGAGRPPKQSTSFETEDPTPSTITRVPKRHPFQNPIFSNPLPGILSPHTRRIVQEDNSKFHEMTVRLYRQESGFGFRIIGGTEEGSQVSVGHIVPGGAADVDGQLQTGDEILYVNNVSVINSSHHRVVQLMSNASLHGHVTLVVRKRLQSSNDGYPYDIIVTRRENEGFGFVIISSVTKSGSTIGEFIGRILENSPAERCGMLHVGDRILAVNGVDISHLHHEDIVNIIKESGYSVTLTIGPPQDDTSSNTSASQRSSQGSMVNATAYPAMNDVDARRFDRPDAPFLSSDRLHYLPPIPPPKDINRNRLPSNPQVPEEGEVYSVELQRGARGFGFSIRGGQEFNNMPLFVLRIAEGGAADLDGRLRVGDQLLEINNYTTGNMTHSEAIDIIQNGGPTVKLLVRRTGKPPPSIEPSHPQGGRFQSAQMANGPIGQSSPYLGRRNRPGDQLYTYQGSRNNPNY